MLNQIVKIDVVIDLYQRDEIIVQKIHGRRICPICGKIFSEVNMTTEDGYALPPLLPSGKDKTICDNHVHEPVKLITRPDDSEEVLLRRIEIHKQETKPIV